MEIEQVGGGCCPGAHLGGTILHSLPFFLCTRHSSCFLSVLWPLQQQRRRTWQGDEHTNITNTYGRKLSQTNISPSFYTSLPTVPITSTDVSCDAFLQFTFTSLKSTNMLTVVVTGKLTMPRYVAFSTSLLPRPS
jgi:hypothetical protein